MACARAVLKGARQLEKLMTDTFDVSLTRNEIAIIHKALGEHLTFLLKEWEHQERSGAADAATSLFEQADAVRTLMNKVGAAPLNLR
jgi:hypothetical protein